MRTPNKITGASESERRQLEIRVRRAVRIPQFWR